MIDGGDVLGVCAINVAEFVAGVRPPDRESAHEFLAALSYWHISYAAARQAGIWRYSAARTGVQLSTTDTLIAAVAHEQDAIVITRNLRHFPMPEVRVLGH